MDLSHLVDIHGRHLFTEEDSVSRTRLEKLEKELRLLESEVERSQ